MVGCEYSVGVIRVGPKWTVILLVNLYGGARTSDLDQLYFSKFIFQKQFTTIHLVND